MIIIWKSKNIIDLTKTHLPNTYAILQEIVQSSKEEFKEFLFEKYPLVDSISVDYGIMEKANEICVIPSNFGWDDIGSWEAIERYMGKDEYGNIHMGFSNTVDGENNLVISHNNKVIIEGLSGIYLIENEGKIIVGKKENITRIKEYRNII